MSEESSYLKIALVVSIVAIIALVFINYVDLDKDNDEHPDINDGLSILKEFNLTDIETGTTTKGTFFIIQSGHSLHVKISADIFVGSTDIGGISFNIPPELQLTNVLCSLGNDTSDKHVSIWNSAAENIDYTTRVEIARSYPPQYIPIGGGEGMLLLDLQLKRSTTLSEIDSLNFSIAVGGKIKDGIAIMGTVYEKITILLS